MTESPNNSTLPIIDSTGTSWLLVPSIKHGLQAAKNGVVDTKTANIQLLLYYNKKIYIQMSTGWKVYSNSAWVASSDPRVPTPAPTPAPTPPPPPVESANGTTVSTVGPVLVDSLGEKWGLQSSTSDGLQITMNGAVDNTTRQVVLLVYMNHKVYQENSEQGWWYKTKASDTWTATTDPRVTSPTPTPAPTPSPTPAPTPTTTVTHYGTTPPANAPTGWNVQFFDDFTSFTPSTTEPYATTGAKTDTGVVAKYGTMMAWGSRTDAMDSVGFCDPSIGINPFSQANSVLTITGSLPTAAQKTAMQNAGIGGQPYISGMLQTYPFLSVTGGYFEMNAKIPAGNGMWAAFWMGGSNIEWPPEIDCFEQLGSDHFGMNSSLHFGANGSGSAGFGGRVPADMTTGFHTYGCLWCPNYVASYFDGKLIGSSKNGLGSAQYLIGSVPMYLMMQLQIGVGMGDPLPADSVFPVEMQIDWFRVSHLGPV